jgi:hypothetical protein
VYIAVQHEIKDPDRFWAVTAEEVGAILVSSYPTHDRTKAVCIWQADSTDAFRESLENVVGEAAKNTYFEVDAGFAVGLPERAATGG